MRCFMMRDGHVVMAAVLPENISNDQEASVAGVRRLPQRRPPPPP